MNNKIEILAPAGSYEVFKAVINAGADAVYLAGSMFGARAYAGNLTNEELLMAIDYAKLHKRKLYLTVNTLLKNNEIYNDLYDYLEPLYNAGLDGVIVQDYGVMAYIHECFPDMEIHASTQMTITDKGYIPFLKKYGVTRIVPARELSLKEVKELKLASGMEIETFVHGALCYSYSGQCLMSSFIGGRSGNRGRCAQPCRLMFSDGKKERNLLSLKDLCTLEILPDIIEAGVFSLKIEGRMKSAEYAAGVTAIYRKYVDQYFKVGKANYHVDKKDLEALLLLFDRGGITDGYYVRHNGAEMIANMSKSDKELSDKKVYEDRITEEFVRKDIKKPVSAMVTIVKDSPCIMTLTDGEVYATVTGDIASKALNKAITKDDVIKQLSKLGQTVFELESIEIEMDDDVFIPVKNLNELRRNACEEFAKNALEESRRNNAKKHEFSIDSTNNYMGLSVRILTKEQGEAALKYNIHRLIIDTELIEYNDILFLIDKCKKTDTKVYLGFPRIERMEKNFLNKQIKSFIEKDIDGFMIRNIAQKNILDEIGFCGDVLADYNCYAFNDIAANAIMEHGITGITYPVELNEHELKNTKLSNSELIVYGRIPLMISANCIKKTTNQCKNEAGFIAIKDRKSATMPVLTCCRYCYNIIYNSVPLYMLDKLDELKKIDVSYFGYCFTDERPEEVEKILNNTLDKEYTRGHYKRGVE